MTTEKEAEEIISVIDQTVFAKSIDQKDFFVSTPSGDFGISCIETYKEQFKKRYGIPIENLAILLKKSSVDEFNGEVEEVNDEDINKVFKMLELKKALGVSITQGIVFSLRVCLDRLYYNAYIFDRLAENLESADDVRLINLFLTFSKLVKDDLRFITFSESGDINTVPLMKLQKKEENLKKYYESYVSSYDIERVNNFHLTLSSSYALLKVFLDQYPEDEQFSFFKKVLETLFDLIVQMMSKLKEFVLLANAYDLISIAPKEVVRPTQSLFFEKKDKSKSEVKQLIIKKASQGIITGIVLEPGDSENRDKQDQFISKEEISKAMVGYMKNHQKLGLMHESILKSDISTSPDAVLLENYLAPQDLDFDGEIAKEGSWIQTWQVLNKKILKKLDSGDYTGFSIGGKGSVIPDEEDILNEV